MRSSAVPSRRSAFTLIEVLVSLAIFALAAVILGATYVNVLTSYAAVAKLNAHEQDLRFVRGTILLGEPDRKEIEKGGELALPDNRRARWEAEIEETTVADLFRVKLRCEVSDPARGEPWKGEENFLLLRPTWSDPAVRDRLRQESQARLLKERGATP
jgi:general secretion pathway protein I